jgi:hypothetical protein
MSADRELLELAAKASGHGLPGPEDTDEIGRQYVYSLGLWVNFPWGFDWWAPLTDDGDAFRLAVKLNFNVCKREHEVEIFNDDNGEFLCSISISEGDDPCAATRRAIVRAAAEIGRATP